MNVFDPGPEAALRVHSFGEEEAALPKGSPLRPPLFLHPKEGQWCCFLF